MEVKGRRAIQPGQEGTGHKGVFVRKGETRFPIREPKGPSLKHVYVGGIVNKAVKLVNKQLPKEINTQIDLVLKRKKISADKKLRKSG